MLNRVAQAACIFTAGSRELLGSRVVGKSWGVTYSDAPFSFPGASPRRTPLRALARAASSARSVRVAHSLRSFALSGDLAPTNLYTLRPKPLTLSLDRGTLGILKSESQFLR